MTTYSQDLRLSLIADGTQVGTWGDTTNANLGTLIEQAIAGVSGGPSTTGTYPSITMPSDANYALTANNGAVDQARNAVIVINSTPTLSQTRYIIAPAGASKVYIVKNNTSGSQAIAMSYGTTSSPTGAAVSVANGTTSIVYGDGTNFYGVSASGGGGGGSSIAINEQAFVATAGQTVFNLTSFSYTPGINSLQVYVNGLKQVLGEAYTETSTTSFTFVSGLNDGAIVEALGGAALAQSISALNVSYNEGGTGAVTTTVQAKLQQTVSVMDFGAKGDGTTDDTAAIQAAINVNGGNVSVYFPTGVYKITSTINLPASSSLKMYGNGFNPQETSNATHGSIVKWSGAANGKMFNGYFTNGTLISGLIIQDLRIDGNSIASIGMMIGSSGTGAAHPQGLLFNTVQFANFATNGTDAVLDLSGGNVSTVYGVADSSFINLWITAGARALRCNSQQLNFYGGALGAPSGAYIVELGDNAHPKFFGTGFYSGPGNPASVFGVVGTIGIDGLECYSCWNEGQACLFKRISGSTVSAYRVTFENQRCALSGGTTVVDLTNENCNLTWVGGFNDNTAQSQCVVNSGSSMTVFNLEAGALTYTGTGIAIEYNANGINTKLGAGVNVPLQLANSVAVQGTTTGGSSLSMIQMNSNNTVVIGNDGQQLLTKLSAMPNSVYPAPASQYDGVIGVDETNKRLVFYAGGTRYYVNGTSY